MRCIFFLQEYNLFQAIPVCMCGRDMMGIAKVRKRMWWLMHYHFPMLAFVFLSYHFLDLLYIRTFSYLIFFVILPLFGKL
jgi:hypothetical protein